MQIIHLFNRNTFSLWHQEVDPEDTADHAAGEEEVDSVAHLLEHVRGCLGNSKVVEPVGCGHEDLRHWSSGVVECFGAVDPRQRVVTERVEGGPNVEEDERRVAWTVDVGLLVKFRFSDGNVAGEVVHGNRTTRSRNHQKTATTDGLDEEKDEKDGSNGFDHTKYAGTKQPGRSTRNTERTEHCWRIEVDSVDAGSIL